MSKVIGYSRVQIGLHWGIVLLLLVNFFTHEAMKSAWYGVHKGIDNYGNTAALHVWVGVTVFVLALARIAIRLTRGAPDLPEGGHPMLDKVAKLTHLALYALILLLPLSGMVAWFGGLDAAGEGHEVMFNLLWVLAGLHVVGAIYHQFVLKDGLMERMKRPV